MPHSGYRFDGYKIALFNDLHVIIDPFVPISSMQRKVH